MLSRLAPRTLLAMALAVGLLVPAAGSAARECSGAVLAEHFTAAVQADYPDQRFSVDILDLGTGCRYRWNAGESITTASVRKIAFLAGAILHAQDDGRWLTAWERSRAEPMMTRSANSEATQLRTHLGGRSGMAAVDQRLGMRDTTATDPWGATPTSAQDQLRVLRRTLANETELFTQQGVTYMRELMTSVVGSQRWGISGGVPHDWTVAQKNGFYPLGGAWRVNSVGMVETPSGDSGYLIVILSDGWQSMPAGIAAVERISRHVAESLTPGDAVCDEPTLVGTDGDDLLIGTPGDDVIVGRAGNDRIRGLGGADVICGGPGDDIISGNEGRDTLRGGSGDDTLYGGKARDVLLGGAGNDQLFGRTAADKLLGGEGRDILRGGERDDRLRGGAGDDDLDGGGGDDFLAGGRGADRCADPGRYEAWLVWSGCESS